MRYWVYINDKVEGPFDEDKLVTLRGFTQDTLICSEDTANSGNQEWVKASSIFEFDQTAQTTAGSAETASNAAAGTNDALAALLLSKLDALTNQISGLQTKLDGMQDKLDDAITAHKESPATQPLIPADDSHANTITLTRHDIEAQVEEVLPPSEDEKPLDMLGPVDLGEHPEDDLAAKAGEDVVVSAALDSLYNANLRNQQDQNESTFQELLTPKQAAELAANADEALAAHEQQERTLDEALRKVEKEADDPQAKDKLIDSFSTATQPDVVDQVIQEKEEEKQTDSGIGLAAAGAAALAGAAAFAAFNSQEKKPAENTEPAAANVSDMPDLSTANEVTDSSTTNANEADIPSLDGYNQERQEMVTDTASQGTMQELVPGAKLEESTNEPLISEKDLNEAFAERDAQEAQSVEQLFGLPQANSTENSVENQKPTNDNLQMEGLASVSQEPQEPSPSPLAPANPNELTEIELKEGSTYLISDFVPPAQANTTPPTKEQQAVEKKEEEQNQKAQDENEKTELQELVTSKKQEEKPLEVMGEDVPKDVTVSQVILENTIKTKRGASLDIKTVPMVPEPGDSPRLHLEGMDDDLNTQHDLQEADIKPAGKGTKAVVASLVMLLLIAVLYALLAFLHIIPEQYNIFSNEKAVAAQQAEQNAQMEEMLTTQDETQPEEVTETAEETTAVSLDETDPMNAVLEEVKAYPLPNGYTLKDFVNSKHPAVQDLITWEIATAVDPDNYSILVKVPPENPQSFKVSYRFNYNAATQALEPTISDAKNLLDSAQGQPTPVPAQ